jgi:hypothetical protein
LMKKLSVPAGATKKVQIVTMPQGGTSYPVKIVVQSEYVKDK